MGQPLEVPGAVDVSCVRFVGSPGPDRTPLYSKQVTSNHVEVVSRFIADAVNDLDEGEKAPGHFSI